MPVIYVYVHLQANCKPDDSRNRYFSGLTGNRMCSVHFLFLMFIMYFTFVFILWLMCVNNYVTTLCLKKKQTSHLWFAITFTYVNAFWYFLAEMSPIM